MPNLEDIIVKVRADISEFKKGMEEAGKGLDGLGGKGKSAGDSLGGFEKAAGGSKSALERMRAEITGTYGATDQLTRSQVSMIRGLEDQVMATRLSGKELAIYTNLRRAGATADSEAGKIIHGLTTAHYTLNKAQNEGAAVATAWGTALRAVPASLSATGTAVNALGNEMRATRTVSGSFFDGFTALNTATIGAGNGMRVLTSHNDRLGASMRATLGSTNLFGRELRALDPTLVALTATQAASTTSLSSWRNLWGLLGPAVASSTGAIGVNAAATRAMAGAHAAAGAETRFLREGLHVLGPVAAAAGLNIHELGRFSSASKAGIAGLGLAIAGTFIVALARAGDEAILLKKRLTDLLGSGDAGRQAMAGLENSARRLGTTAGAMADPITLLSDKLKELNYNAGVRLAPLIEGARGLTPEFQRAALAVDALGNFLSGDIQEATKRREVTRALVFDMVTAEGLTLATYRQIRQLSPATSDAIARQFGLTFEGMIGRLKQGPIAIELFIDAMRKLGPASELALAKARAESDTTTGAFSRLWSATDRLWRKISEQSGIGPGFTNALRELAAGATSLERSEVKVDGFMKTISGLGSLLNQGVFGPAGAAKLLKGLDEMFDLGVGQAFERLGAAIKQGLSDLGITQAFAQLGAAIKEGWNLAWGGFTADMAELWGAIRKTVGEGVDWIVQKLSGFIPPSIGGAWNNLVATISGAIRSIIDWANRGVVAIQNFLNAVSLGNSARVNAATLPMSSGGAAGASVGYYSGSSVGYSSGSVYNAEGESSYTNLGDYYGSGGMGGLQGDLYAYAKGAVGTVPLGYDRDNFPVRFNAQSGEKIIVVPRGKTIDDVLNEKNPIHLGNFATGGAIDITSSGIDVTRPPSATSAGPQVDAMATGSGNAVLDLFVSQTATMRKLGFDLDSTRQIITNAGNNKLPDVIRQGTLQVAGAIKLSETAITTEISATGDEIVGAITALSEILSAASASASSGGALGGGGIGGEPGGALSLPSGVYRDASLAGGYNTQEWGSSHKPGDIEEIGGGMSIVMGGNRSVTILNNAGAQRVASMVVTGVSVAGGGGSRGGRTGIAPTGAEGLAPAPAPIVGSNSFAPTTSAIATGQRYAPTPSGGIGFADYDPNAAAADWSGSFEDWFATPGEFDVPKGFKNDSFGALLHLSEGERVSVTRTGQSEGAVGPSGGNNIIDLFGAQTETMRKLGLSFDDTHKIITGIGSNKLPDVIRQGTQEVAGAIKQSETTIPRQISVSGVNTVVAVNAGSADTVAAINALSSALATAAPSGPAASTGAAEISNQVVKGPMGPTILKRWKGDANRQVDLGGAMAPDPGEAGANLITSMEGSFAEPGYFDVPKGYKHDSFKTRLHLSEGERVSITRTGQREGMTEPSGAPGGGKVININIAKFEVVADDPKQFAGTAAQTESVLRRTLNRSAMHE